LNTRIFAIALGLAAVGVLSAAQTAHAQSPDLAITTSWQQVGDTTTVIFTMTVENVSPDVTFIPSDTVPVDVMLFPNLDHQPNVVAGDASPQYQWLVDTTLPPGATWVRSEPVDYQATGNFEAWVIVDTLGYALPEFGFPETTKANNIDGPVPVTVDESQVVLEADLTCSLVAEVQGNKVVFKTTVQNIGPIPAPDCFKVDVLYDTPSCPPTDWQTVPNTMFGDVFATVQGGLGAGATKQVIIADTAAPPGTHSACAMIDLDDCVDEANEAGNNWCGPASYTIQDIPDEPQCDLDIDVFSVQALGPTVTYCTTVRNVGDKACPGFTVDLWYNSLDQPDAADLPNHFWLVNSLAVQDEWTDCHEQSPAPNGQYQAWVVADPDNVTNDAFATNNVNGPFPYTIAVPDDNPDIVIVDAEWQEIAGQICFDITVRNAGTSEATDFPIDIFYSFPTNPSCFFDDLSSAPSDQALVTLGPGAQQTVQECWEAPSDGEHTAWVKADCLSSVQETDKTNNDMGPIAFAYEQVLQEGVDLRAADFKAKVTCTLVNFSGICRNSGDTTATPFQLDIFYNSETNPNFNPPGDFTLFVPVADPENPANWLPPGQDIPVSHNRSFESGTYRSWFVCDTNNDVNEDNVDNNAEGNNISFVEFVVDETGCGCEDNVLITNACSCAGETVFEGFCCNGQWGFEEFDECLPPVADGDGTGTGDDDTGTVDPVDGSGTGGDAVASGSQVVEFDIEANRTTASQGGCTASNGSGGGGPLGLLLLVVFGMAVRRLRFA
jgi:hypothetical protein